MVAPLLLLLLPLLSVLLLLWVLVAVPLMSCLALHVQQLHSNAGEATVGED
jgi:hypothetical protein